MSEPLFPKYLDSSWGGINDRIIPILGRTVYRFGSFRPKAQCWKLPPIHRYFDLRQDFFPDVDTLSLLTARNIEWISLPLEGFDGFGPQPLVSPEMIKESYIRLLVLNRRRLSNLVHFIKECPTPVGIGCFAGKDRTGVAAYVLARFFGTDLSAIALDYAASESRLKSNVDYFENNWLKKGITREQYRDRIHCPVSVIYALDAWVTSSYGGIHEYLS